jgi:nephrocystin-3
MPPFPDNKSPHDTRQIRVFISSTFRDMMEERDVLVKFIFPQLRRLCESRGVTWGEVDLRWGVTDEAAAEGKVLPICLEEINRCRPYFIGLLGERYGWVPDSIPEALLEKEPWLKEQFKGKKSVTELEILHGVLRNPQMAGHAFFYFRDPAYIQSLPKKVRDDFVSESPEEKEKLRKLKEQIRKSGLSVQENYPDPKALGELVLADLTEVIDQYWPEGSQPDPLTREALDHAAFARSRERVYIGRKAYFDKLDAHAKAKGNQPLVILGESGSGKSALLANWTARYRESHHKDLIIEHYIGATPASTDWAAMLRRIMSEFKEKLGLTEDIPEQPDALRSAFPNWLHMAAAKGKVILVLDALNQLEDRDGAPDLVWLPPVMPENVRLIVSTLPGRALDEITKRKWPVFKVEPLGVEERKELIRQFLGEYSRTLSPKRVDQIANAPQSANPLYLRVLLDELRLFGEHERLEERINYYLEAGTPYELYEKVIIRWENDYEGDSDLVGDTLSLLWAARHGLTESELLHALGKNSQPLPRAVWSPLFLAMSDSLINRQGLLTFAHDFLRIAARDAYIPTESHQHEAHIRLADYFERQSPSLRRTDEFPWQLAEACAWQRLSNLIADRNFVNDKFISNKYDLKRYWKRIESGSSLRIINAYHNQIEHPDDEGDKAYLFFIGKLLMEANYFKEALGISISLVNNCKEIGDMNGLVTNLNLQAVILQHCDDLDKAMSLYKEVEQICRRLDDLDNLQICLNNQALISYKLGDLEGATTLYKEAEQICHQLGYLEGLRIIFNNQGMVSEARNDLDGAMVLYRKAEQIYRQVGDLDGLLRNIACQVCILANQGEKDKAMALIRKSKQIYLQFGDVEGVMTILNTLSYILLHRGDKNEAIELDIEAEQICRQFGYFDGLQKCLNHHGKILENQGNLDDAMSLYKEAEQISRHIDNFNGLQISLNNQAVILQKRGDLDEALKLLKKNENACRENNNQNGLSLSLGNQGWILEVQGDLAGAMALYKKAEQICRQSRNQYNLPDNLFNQGRILEAYGDIDKALALYKEAEEICYHSGKLDVLQNSLSRQADILQNSGDLDKAMTLSKAAEDICRRSKNLNGLQDILFNEGVILHKRGDLQKALDLYKEVEQICLKINDQNGLQMSLGNQGVILQNIGNLETAMNLHKKAEQICRQLGNLDSLKNTLFNQGIILSEQNDIEGAMALFKEAEEICQQTGDQNDLLTILSRQEVIFQKRGDLEGAMSLYKKIEQVCRELGDLNQLSASLNNQAVILQNRGEVDKAIALYKDAEQICRQSGNIEGLARSLTNQALTLRMKKRANKGIPLLKEAFQLAMSHGYTELGKQIEQFLNSIH